MYNECLASIADAACDFYMQDGWQYEEEYAYWNDVFIANYVPDSQTI